MYKSVQLYTGLYESDVRYFVLLSMAPCFAAGTLPDQTLDNNPEDLRILDFGFNFLSGTIHPDLSYIRGVHFLLLHRSHIIALLGHSRLHDRSHAGTN